MFRVIIAGGRDFSDYDLLRNKCDKILAEVQDITIVSGRAKGADMLGEKYAQERQFPIAIYPADWDKHGKSAGAIRNEEMAQNADALIAFWDGKSRGTKDMITRATKYGLKVRVIRY